MAGERSFPLIVLNIVLVPKTSHRRSSIVQEITATDRELLLDHDESLYCLYGLLGSSEDEEGASPAATMVTYYEESYLSDEESGAGEQPAAEIQEA